MTKKGSYKKYYTVYDNRTDEIVVSGTSQECAEKLNIRLGSFYSLVCNTVSGHRYRSFSVVVDHLRMNDHDDEDDD